MDSINRCRRIDTIHSQVGWIYKDLPWLSAEDAARANEQREELLKSLSGWITYSFRGSKLHFGDLSPGCSICGQGAWGCNYINRMCNRHCFYCPRDRSLASDCDPQTDGIHFKNPSDHIIFLKTFQIKGVGFSGGEPLLVLDRLLEHIHAIRQEFGDMIYLWIYTNGDLINHDSLKKLADAGLDEIRVDLSAREYDLSPIELIKDYIPTVTVEIPAIPEDFDLVKDLLAEMSRKGVDFLNLHQLHASEHNYRELCKRNYHFIHDQNLPVIESEITALKLLAFAREHKIGLPINYCCPIYKRRFQGLGRRARLCKVILKEFEEMTNAAYIRSFKVLDSTGQIEKLIGTLEDAGCPNSQWKCNENKTEILLHSSLLARVESPSAKIELTYFEPGISLKEKDYTKLDGNLGVVKSAVYQKSGWSKTAVDSWHRLYLEGSPKKDVFSSFLRRYPKVSRDFLVQLQKETSELMEIEEFEDLGFGLAEIF
jgi:pyruvate formate-lyase activating enzyme-like uncharacterized protein